MEIPDFFDKKNQEAILFQATSETEPFRLQKKSLKLYLFKKEELLSETYQGESLEEKWEDYCLYLFKSEKISREQATLKDYKVWKMHGKTDAVFQKDHFKIQYFFATIFLDETYALQFEAMHEIDEEWVLEGWVDQIYTSLKIKGDERHRDTAFRSNLVETEEAEMKYQKEQEQRFLDEEEVKRTKEYPIEIPVDGKDYFKVGDFEFEFVLAETNWEIGCHSKDLYVTLKAKTNDLKEAQEAELLADYPGDGLVTLNVPARGIHQNGIPTGSLRFEEEKTNAPLFLNALSNGFDYRLAFNGVATFKEGWVLLSGEMTKSYHDKSFPIQIAKKFNAGSLNWKDYQFTSMQETATTNANDVRFLFLQNPTFTKLPEAVFTFKNIENFAVQQRTHYGNKEKLPLEQIQEEIGQLKQLKSLHINGAAIRKLPESISNLSNLEQLSVGGCLLEAVPEGVFKLQKLKYLWLIKNLLTQIPKDIDLPSLENISLNDNQLKTLPASLAEQPKLKKIDLKHNPWEALPENFNYIQAVELDMEDKLRLLDFEYKGADGKGLGAWDDTVFYALDDADLLPEIDIVIKENELTDKADALRSLVKKAISFTHHGEEDYKQVGNHRFGGMPDLPEAMAYPEFFDDYHKKTFKYEFIGQINCGEIAHLQGYLPRTGILHFFLETLHNVYGETNNPCKVLYCKDASTLVSGKRFKFPNTDYFEMMDSCYSPYKVTAKKINSAPSFYSSYVNSHLFLGAAEVLKDDEDFLEEAYDVFEEPLGKHNKYDYAVNAYGFSQHEHPELQASLAKKGNPQDWMTLLTVSSTGDMQWGDAGDLFFVIHKSDLARGDFSNVFVTMESS